MYDTNQTKYFLAFHQFLTFSFSLEKLSKVFTALFSDVRRTFAGNLLWNKAMRLPEIFAFQQFPIAESQKFLTVKNRPKLSHLYFAFDFRKNLTKTTKIIKNFDICQKFRYIYRLMSKLTVEFSGFLT